MGSFCKGIWVDIVGPSFETPILVHIWPKAGVEPTGTLPQLLAEQTGARSDEVTLTSIDTDVGTDVDTSAHKYRSNLCQCYWRLLLYMNPKSVPWILK